MIAIVHSIYSQSVHAPALNAGLMDNDAERYCTRLEDTPSTTTHGLRFFRKLEIHCQMFLSMP